MLAAALALTGCTKKNDATATFGRGAGERAECGGLGRSASGQKVKVAFVPKLQGIPYFEAMNAGGEAGGRGAA